MLIFIRALAGTVIRLNVRPCETVENVKSRIAHLKGIPVSQQHLIFDGVELSNATLLAAAQISHGALLRLVLGVQSGPLNRDTARTLGSAQPCHRLSAAGRHSVCPLTVPVAPMYRIPATTMVLPVLCTPNRGSGTEHESHHHHQHHQHQHHLYKYHPYHPSFPYLTGSMNTYCSDRILANKTEWDEPTLYTVHEFATDEETTGSGEEAVSDLDEYLEYAIDEDELNLGQSGKGSSRSSPLVDDSYECSDSVVEGRKSLDSPPAALSGPSTFPISASSRSSSTSSSSPSVFSSECQLFPVYSIPSQVQWILGHTNLSQLTFTQPHQPLSHDPSLPSPSIPSSSSSSSVAVAHYTTVPMAYGIPVSLPLGNAALSECNPFTVFHGCSTPDRPTPSTPTAASADAAFANLYQPTKSPLGSPMAFAVPTHLAPVQLANFLPNFNLPSSNNLPLSESNTTAIDHTAAINKRETSTITTTTKSITTHLPGLVVSPFTLLPIGHFCVTNHSPTSSISLPIPTGLSDVSHFPKAMNKQSPESSTDAKVTTASVNSGSRTLDTPRPGSELSNTTAQTSIPRSIRHSNQSHIPGTEEQSMSTTVPVAEQTHCFSCQKRTRLAQGFSCRCQKWFCQKHHHPEDHNCAFDFKTMRLISPCSPVMPCPSDLDSSPVRSTADSNRCVFISVTIALLSLSMTSDSCQFRH
ncbi:putative ubiquitin 1 [Fasciolopsis buskii]|uniref:Putative ubiquitin 1 n=1 Tax=Fasciolopsis buskii TaxID=27845 RepID=A0A8E0VIY5_9TREM|nr:putative ubiquitin 1 [Fasciolopsis buski]